MTRFGEGKRRSDARREKELVRQKGQDLQYMQQERQRLDAEERARQLQLAKQAREGRRQQQVIVFASLVVVLMMIGGLVAYIVFVMGAK
jgi:hypothetical protein